MMKKIPLYQILSAIHVVFFTSLLCFGLTFLSGMLLAIPAFAAAFQIGKDWMYDELDINSSIIRGYLGYFRESLRLLRFLPVSLVMVLNLAGILTATKLQSFIYAVICMAIFALLMTVALYIAGYNTFVSKEFKLLDVVIAMFLKPLTIVTIMIIMVLCTYFFSGTLAVILLLMGTFFLFVIEVVIFITMLYYLKLTKQLDEEDKFAYLVSEKRKKCQK